MGIGIYFKPWVGEHYYDGINGKRVMVLGHCHYCDDGSENEQFTNDIINGYIEWIRQGRPIERDNKGAIKDRWVRTYESFAKALLGYESGIEEISQVWDRILFYNYVQIAVASADSKPTAKDYKDSQEGFISVLKEYEPDIIIVWGNVYDKTPDWNGKRIDDIYTDCLNAICWGYTFPSGRKCKMFKIHHPSQAFQWREWHKIIKMAIE